MRRVHVLQTVMHFSIVPTAAALLLFWPQSAAAQSSTSTQAVAVPTPAASGAVPGTGTKGYAYSGCYNETTWLPAGTRALKDGTMNADNKQTLTTCLDFCASNSYQYCGLEYGSECWGSKYLSSQSKTVGESNCSIGCAGNNSQVCGGRLAITLYNRTADVSGGSATGEGASKEVAGMLGGLALAAGMGLLFCGF